MTIIGWVQILLFCAIIVALTPVLGGYMTRVFSGERTFLTPILRPVELALYRAAGVDEKREQGWLAYTIGMLLFHVGGFFNSVRTAAFPGQLAVQSGRAVGGGAGSHLQHGDQLHHQHELAELRRRGHDVVPHADARPDASKLPVGGDGHRTRGRAHSRFCASLGADDRQLLGRRHALHSLRPHAHLHRCDALSRLAGHAADARTLCRCDDARGRQTDDRSWTGRVAGRHQDARHQWRRLLQRQRRASVREPDGAVEFRADHPDLCARRCAHQCVRPHGRQPAPGLGDPRCDGRAVHCRRYA